MCRSGSSRRTVSSTGRLLHQEPGLRHGEGTGRDRVGSPGRSPGWHPEDGRVVSRTGVAVSQRLNVVQICDHLGWPGSRMHGVKRLFAWMLPRFDPERFSVSLISLREPDTSGDTLESLGIDVTYSRSRSSIRRRCRRCSGSWIGAAPTCSTCMATAPRPSGGWLPPDAGGRRSCTSTRTSPTHRGSRRSRTSCSHPIQTWPSRCLGRRPSSWSMPGWCRRIAPGSSISARPWTSSPGPGPGRGGSHASGPRAASGGSCRRHGDPADAVEGQPVSGRGGAGDPRAVAGRVCVHRG